MKIGFRTLKTAIGVCLSILIAQWLQLEFFTAAGILTLLCIQRTRKQSARAVLDRFFACLLGILIAGLLFMLVGFHATVFLLLYLIFIPLCVKFNIQGGIASSSVIMLHIYVHGTVDAPFILNELGIIIIGLGVALLVNWYMPGADKRMEAFRSEINQHMSVILAQFALYLKQGYSMWDGKEILQLADRLRQARNLALLEIENQAGRKNNSYYQEFERKQAQYLIIERMLPLVSRIELQLEQGERIGSFMDKLSRDIEHLSNNEAYAEELRKIREYHKGLAMPSNRTEFESRANLYTLANEIESLITHNEKKSY